MGRIDNDGWARPDTFQTPREVTAARPARTTSMSRLALRTGIEEQLHSRQGQRSIRRLMFAVQWQVQLVVLATKALDREHLPTPTARVRFTTANSTPSRTGVISSSTHRAISTAAASGSCRAGSERAPALRIPAFSVAILRQRVTQVVGVIEAHGCHNGDGWLNDVRGIPGAAHAALNHHHVDRGIGETGERQKSSDCLEHQVLN